MCLAALSINPDSRFPWVLASNRDEFFDRPAAPLAWWRPVPGQDAVLSGRDLSAGGTWLALNAAGRLALVTNVREPGRFDPAAPSRGALVLQGLRRDPGHGDDAAWLQGIAREPRNGFNLILADLQGKTCAWATNRPPQHRLAGPGVHAVSNASLDTPWPKLTRLKQRLADAVAQGGPAADLADTLFDALADRAVAPDAELPSTGVPLERERQLSPAFIHMAAPSGQGAAYGTRCSTLVVVERQAGRRVVHVSERSFDAAAAISGTVTLSFELP